MWIGLKLIDMKNYPQDLDLNIFIDTTDESAAGKLI